MHDNKLKILAIDDDEESLSLLKVIVEKSFSNVKFLQACDSVEGLKLARAENPDVVLLDVLMPVVDGFEVCRQFKANAFLVSIPIIFLTALAMDKELLAKALLAGVEGFLFKPIEEAALIAQIRVMARIKAVNDKESREKERLFSLLAERTQEVIEAEEGHQKAEDALKSMEDRYGELFSKMKEGFALHEIICDKNGHPVDYRFLAVNPAFERLTGFASSALLGHTVLEVMPATEKRWIEAYGHVALTQQSLHFEGFAGALGKYYSVTAFSPKQGQFAVICSDITERHNLYAKLEESERKYHLIFEQAHDSIILLHPEDSGPPRIIDINPAALIMHGYAREELVGKTLDFLVAEPDSLDLIRKRQALVYRRGSASFVTQHRCKTGEVITLENSVRLAEMGGQRVIIDIARDITERSAAETDTQRRSELLSLLNTCSDLRRLTQMTIGLLCDWAGCEAVGIRMKDGEDYPYFETRGFPSEFIGAENSLCARDAAGEICRTSSGDYVIECMCGNVLYGRFDPAKPFFTAKGSFWSNCTTELLASTTDADRQACTRNRCNGDGYESVALIPLRSGVEILGLLQLNSKQKGRFKRGMLSFLEDIADQLATAIVRIQAREALRVSEDRLIKAQLTAKVGNWEANLQTRRVWASEEARSIYGFALNEAITLDMLPKNTLAQYRPVLDQAMVKLLTGAGSYDQEFEIEQQNTGAILCIHSKAELALDGKGDAIIVGVIQDVTESRRAQTALRKSDVKFKELVDSLNDVIYTLNAQGIVTYMGPQTVRLTGFNSQDYVWRPFAELVYPQDLPIVLRTFKERMDGNAGLAEFRYLHKDGSLRWARSSGRPIIENGRVVGVSGLLTDITERKKTEAMLEDIIDKNPLSIQILDKDGCTVKVNPAYTALFSVVPTAGFSIFSHLARKSPEMERLILRVKNGEAVSLPAVFYNQRDVSPDLPDNPLWIQAIAFPLKDATGKPERFVLMYENVTERKQADDKIKASLAEKDVLLKEVHHRVKNNLQVVSSLLNLQSRTINDEAVQSVFDESRARVRAMALVHEILYRTHDFAKLNMRDYAGKLIEALAGAFSAGARVRFAIDICDSPLSVDTAVSLGLILNELVANSLKHGFADGRTGVVAVNLVRESGGYCLKVEDDGPGLPANYDLRKAKSLGMQLVSTLAGQISGTVEAFPGKGARIHVRFPFPEERGGGG